MKTDMWRLLPPLVLGAALNPLNSTMLSTALTRLTHSFGRDLSAGALLITPLYITATVAQPLMGRLADLYSPRRVNLVGLWLVLVAALIGVLAPSFGWLVFSRILLGLGTSANYPSAVAILRNYYTKKGAAMPANALGWIAVGGQASMVLGPVIGGAVTEWWGWKGIFLINMPLVLITVWLARSIPPDEGNHSGRRLDIPGIALFSGALVMLFFVLTNRPLSWVEMGAMIVLMGALVIWEKRQSDPFLHVRLFWQQPALSLVYIQSAASCYILYLILYGLPQWLQGVKGLSPSQTGLVLLPMSLVSAAMSLLISRQQNLPGITLLGALAAALSCGALFLLQAGSPMGEIVIVAILAGTSMGINPMVNQSALNAKAPRELTGISFGLYRTFAYLGAITSGAHLKFIFRKGLTDGGFRTIAWYSFYSTLIMIVLYLPVWWGRRRTLPEEGQVAERAG